MQKSHVNVTIQLSIDLDHKTNLFLTEISSISWRPSTTSESISDDDEKKIYLKNRLFLAKKITQTPFNIDQVKASFLQAILTEIATKTEMPNDYNSGWLCENSDTIAVCNYIQLMCDKLLNC